MEYKKMLFFILLALFSVTSPLFAQNITESKPDACVSGIMYDGDSSSVIVNGETLRLGEAIHNLKVMNITESTVTLQYNDQVLEKRIGEGCVKSAAPIVNKSTAVNNEKNLKTSVRGESQMKNSKEIEKLLSGQALVLVLVIFAIALIGYIYNSVCLQKIADKTATANGWLAWIPIANLFLMLMIARKSFWWIALLFIPLVNFVIMVILWMEISKMRDKPAWLGILMIFPIVNLIILGYLAFSGNLSIPAQALQIKRY